MNEHENLPDLPLELQPLSLDPQNEDTGELRIVDVVTQRELEALNITDAMLALEVSRLHLRLSRGAQVEPGPRRISRAGIDQPFKPLIKFATDPDSSLDVAADIRREGAAALPPRQHRRAPKPTITVAGIKRKVWLQLLASVDMSTPKGRRQVMEFIAAVNQETERLIANHAKSLRRNRCYDLAAHVRLIAKLRREYLLLRGALFLHRCDMGDWRGCVADRGTRILALREQYLPA